MTVRAGTGSISVSSPCPRISRRHLPKSATLASSLTRVIGAAAKSLRTAFTVNTIHSGFLRYSFGSEKDSVRGRIYRKLFEATFFFRRSFHRSDTNWSAVVSLGGCLRNVAD
jgi:hypothetical protein